LRRQKPALETRETLPTLGTASKPAGNRVQRRSSGLFERGLRPAQSKFLGEVSEGAPEGPIRFDKNEADGPLNRHASCMMGGDAAGDVGSPCPSCSHGPARRPETDDVRDVLRGAPSGLRSRTGAARCSVERGGGPRRSSRSSAPLLRATGPRPLCSVFHVARNRDHSDGRMPVPAGG